jgi:hypothetical protein
MAIIIGKLGSAVADMSGMCPPDAEHLLTTQQGRFSRSA